MMHSSITLDWTRVQKLAGIKIPANVATDLIEHLTIYRERWRDDQIPDFMTCDLKRPNEVAARRAVITTIWETWNDHRRRLQRRPRDQRRRNYRKVFSYRGTDKHFINLLDYLFRE